MELIYSAGGRVNRVRLVMVLSWIFGIFFFYLAFDALLHYGYNPASGAPKPFMERLGFAAMVAAVGALLIGAMYVYGRLYVTHIRLSEDEQWIQVSTLKFFMLSSQQFPVSDIKRGVAQWSRWLPKISVDAPYLLMRIRDRRLPYIIDMQKEVMDSERLLNILGVSEGKRPDENVVV